MAEIGMKQAERNFTKKLALVLQQEIKDPRMISMVSVLETSISKDLTTATVKVSIYGDNLSDNQKTFKALESSAGFIASKVSKSLRLRITPQIIFKRTDDIKNAVDFNTHLQSLKDKEADLSNE